MAYQFLMCYLKSIFFQLLNLILFIYLTAYQVLSGLFLAKISLIYKGSFVAYLFYSLSNPKRQKFD